MKQVFRVLTPPPPPPVFECVVLTLEFEPLVGGVDMAGALLINYLNFNKYTFHQTYNVFPFQLKII